MKTRFFIYFVLAALLLLPGVTMVFNDAFGYGGGGGGISYSAPQSLFDTPEEPVDEPEPTPTYGDEEPVSGDEEAATELEKMTNEAEDIAGGNVVDLTSAVGVERDLAKEASYESTLVSKIISGNESEAVMTALVNFITYGTPTTLNLGAGERAGVVDSYQAAFGKLPETAAEWNDVLKIANGRWPSESSQTALDNAKDMFETIYLRVANMDNPNDNAAVTIMAYGLRPGERNLGSEAEAIDHFEGIFGHSPSSATDWDAVRAIAYSGATR